MRISRYSLPEPGNCASDSKIFVLEKKLFCRLIDVSVTFPNKQINYIHL